MRVSRVAAEMGGRGHFRITTTGAARLAAAPDQIAHSKGTQQPAAAAHAPGATEVTAHRQRRARTPVGVGGSFPIHLVRAASKPARAPTPRPSRAVAAWRRRCGCGRATRDRLAVRKLRISPAARNAAFPRVRAGGKSVVLDPVGQPLPHIGQAGVPRGELDSTMLRLGSGDLTECGVDQLPFSK
jgi:hypothetical protein